MSKVLIIGCGGVASVAIHKCCQVPEVFTEIYTLSLHDALPILVLLYVLFEATPHNSRLTA